MLLQLVIEVDELGEKSPTGRAPTGREVQLQDDRYQNSFRQL